MHIGPVQDLYGQPKKSCKIPARVLYRIKSRFIQASPMNPVQNLYGSFTGLIQALYVAPTNPVYCYPQYLYPVNMPWCVRIHRESVQCYQHWASSRPVLAHGGMLTGYQCNDWPQMGLDQLSNWIQSISGPLSHISMDKCGAWVIFVIFLWCAGGRMAKIQCVLGRNGGVTYTEFWWLNHFIKKHNFSPSPKTVHVTLLTEGRS